MTWLLYMKNNLPSEKQTLSRFARQLIVINAATLRETAYCNKTTLDEILFSLQGR